MFSIILLVKINSDTHEFKLKILWSHQPIESFGHKISFWKMRRMWLKKNVCLVQLSKNLFRAQKNYCTNIFVYKFGHVVQLTKKKHKTFYNSLETFRGGFSKRKFKKCETKDRILVVFPFETAMILGHDRVKKFLRNQRSVKDKMIKEKNVKFLNF